MRRLFAAAIAAALLAAAPAAAHIAVPSGHKITTPAGKKFVRVGTLNPASTKRGLGPLAFKPTAQGAHYLPTYVEIGPFLSSDPKVWIGVNGRPACWSMRAVNPGTVHKLAHPNQSAAGRWDIYEAVDFSHYHPLVTWVAYNSTSWTAMGPSGSMMRVSRKLSSGYLDGQGNQTGPYEKVTFFTHLYGSKAFVVVPVC